MSSDKYRIKKMAYMTVYILQYIPFFLLKIELKVPNISQL
jgi:hypothetical protein